MRHLFFRKQAHIEQGFEEFLGCIQRCVEIFSTHMLSYLEHGPGESFSRAADLVARAESEADDIRREIERVLYKNELLPDSRGDLLLLLESCDKVANRIEAVINNICLRQVDIPQPSEAKIKELLVPVETAVITLVTAVRLLFSRPKQVKPVVADVERLESESDKILHAAVHEIYRIEDLDLASKIQLERTLVNIASIADRAEDAAHALEIVAIKRTL